MDVSGWQPLIVVGVSGSRASLNALTWAAAEACRRGARLRVVHAWIAHPEQAPYAVSPAPVVPAQAAAGRLARLAHLEQAAGAQIELIDGPPERVLTDASAHADLLVLGAGRQPPVGPVIRACLGLSRCPVVVVGPALTPAAQPPPLASTRAQPPPLAGTRARA